MKKKNLLNYCTEICNIVPNFLRIFCKKYVFCFVVAMPTYVDSCTYSCDAHFIWKFLFYPKDKTGKWTAEVREKSHQPHGPRGSRRYFSIKAHKLFISQRWLFFLQGSNAAKNSFCLCLICIARISTSLFSSNSLSWTKKGSQRDFDSVWNFSGEIRIQNWLIGVQYRLHWMHLRGIDQELLQAMSV